MTNRESSIIDGSDWPYRAPLQLVELTRSCNWSASDQVNNNQWQLQPMSDAALNWPTLLPSLSSQPTPNASQQLGLTATLVDENLQLNRLSQDILPQDLFTDFVHYLGSQRDSQKIKTQSESANCSQQVTSSQTNTGRRLADLSTNVSVDSTTTTSTSSSSKKKANENCVHKCSKDYHSDHNDKQNSCKQVRRAQSSKDKAELKPRNSAPKLKKTPEQIATLTAAYKLSQYPTKEQRLYLERETKLTDSQVRLWFQYQRNRSKRRTSEL